MAFRPGDDKHPMLLKLAVSLLPLSSAYVILWSSCRGCTSTQTNLRSGSGGIRQTKRDTGGPKTASMMVWPER